MTDDEKRRFDAIFGLYERQWEQFNDRRRYEFKVTLAYWTALAAGIAGSVNLSPPSPIAGGRIALVLVAVVGVVLHYLWLKGIWNAGGTDQKIAIIRDKQLSALADAKFAEKDQADISERSKRMGKMSHPCAIFQLGVTFLLLATLVLVNWNRIK